MRGVSRGSAVSCGQRGSRSKRRPARGWVEGMARGMVEKADTVGAYTPSGIRKIAEVLATINC